ncbi:MAG: class I SAM-dependent methyltransferase [Candidatus Diapherotrites archaeon]|nr:class I SAM-dependent methyltransferase [Candidatus Diapherotrites archaeon]
MSKMNPAQKEALVKELYEKYPYPSREVTNPQEIIYFAEWVAKTFGEDKSFWKGKSVLELGCGTGELASALALCGAKVIAIDFSSSSIKHAKRLAKEIGTAKNIAFFEKNILNLSENEFSAANKFETEKKFDVVIALGSLHHTIDALSGFKIACKFAKPEGLVVIGLYNKYARLKHRIKRAFIKAIAGNNIEKRIKTGETLFGNGEKNGKAWAADKYGQVHESYHSVGKVLHWFKEEGIEFISSKPKFEHAVIDEIKWLLEERGAFFVMTGKKK